MMEDFKNTSLFKQIMSWYLFLLVIFLFIIVYIKFYNIDEILVTQTNINYYSTVVIDLLNMQKEIKLNFDTINNNDHISLQFSYLYFMKIYSRELIDHNIANIQYNPEISDQELETTYIKESLDSIKNLYFDLGNKDKNNLNFSLQLSVDKIMRIPKIQNNDQLDPAYLIPIIFTFIPNFFQNLEMNGIGLVNFYFLGYKYNDKKCQENIEDENEVNIFFKYPIETQEFTENINNNIIFDSTLDPVGKCYLSQVRSKDLGKVKKTNWYFNYEEDYINNDERNFDSRLIRLSKVGIDSVKNIYLTNSVSYKHRTNDGDLYIFTFSQKIKMTGSSLPFISYNSYGESSQDFFSMVNFPVPFGKNYTYKHVDIDLNDGVYYKDYNIDDNSTIIMNVPSFINNIYNHAMLPKVLIEKAGSGINDNTLLLTYSEMSKIFDEYSINYYFDLDSLVFKMITFFNNFLQYSNYEKRMIEKFKYENKINDTESLQKYASTLNSKSYHKCSISNLTEWNSKLIDDQEYSYDCLKDYCFFHNCTNIEKSKDKYSYQSRFVPVCYCLPLYCYDPFTLKSEVPETYKNYYDNNQTFYSNSNNFYDPENQSILCRMNFYQKNKKDDPSLYNTHIKLTDAEFKYNTTIFMLYLMEENSMYENIISRFAADTSLVRMIIYIIFICVIFIYFIVFCKCMQNNIERLTERIDKVAVLIKIIFKISGENDENFEDPPLAHSGSMMSYNQLEHDDEKIREKYEEDYMVNIKSNEDGVEDSEDASVLRRHDHITNLNVNLEKELKQLGIVATDYYDEDSSVNEADRISIRYSDELQQFINIIIDNIKEFKIEFNADGNMYESCDILNKEYTELLTSKYYMDKIFANYIYKNQSIEESSSDLIDLGDAKEKGKLSLNLIYELLSTEEINDLTKCVSNFYFKEPKETSLIDFYKWIETLLYDDTDYINEVTDSEKLKTAINFYVHEIHLQWKLILEEKIKNEEF